MPKKNQRSVTLNKKIYEKLRNYVDQLNRQNDEDHQKSYAGFVTDLIAEKTKEA